MSDNEAAYKQIQSGYIRSASNKHIDPKVYRTHDLIEQKKIQLHHVPGNENPADMLTKTLPGSAHNKYMQMIGLRSMREIKNSTAGNKRVTFGGETIIP